MSLDAYVSPWDVERRFGRPFTDAQTDLAATLIMDAAILLTADADLNIEADLLSGALSEGAVAMVIASMVKRAMTAPEGVQTTQTGPFAVTYANPDNSVFLKASERAALTPNPTPRARSVRMGY